MMRKFLILVLGLAMLALFVSEVGAAGVKLTNQQVKSVCGSGMRTYPGGVTGCSKACGLNNEHTCSFECSSSGCAGYCEDCGRTGGKDASAAAVKGLLSRSQ
jgi:hypothetical protein